MNNSSCNALKKKLDEVIALCMEAGAAILDVRSGKHFAVHELKADDSPVTLADHAANAVLVKGLLTLYPNIPILSEESSHSHRFEEVDDWQAFWLVDPLDGTKEFIKGRNQYTVNVALIVNKCPILGVIYVPALDLLYYAAQGIGSYKKEKEQAPERLITQESPHTPLRIAVSSHHPSKDLDELLANLESYTLIQAGSSLKLCFVADGTADIYPRLGLTSQWDIAAGQCVVEQAGGCVIDTHGNTLVYDRKASLLNPHFFALGRTSFRSFLQPRFGS